MTDLPPDLQPPVVDPPSPPPEPAPAPALGIGRQILSRLAQGIALSVVAGILAPVIGFGALFLPGPLTTEKNIVIAHGTRSVDIAQQLATEHAVYHPILFRVAARLLAAGSLKAGEYAVPAHASAVDIAAMMHDGRSVVRLFTAAEGLTVQEILEMLNADPVLTGSLDTPPAEGTLLPETYRYSYGDSRASLIARMQKAMQEKINEGWASREAGLALRSTQEAVILASIVEKETGKPEERARIAGVFFNRLQRMMRLQSDPTVIYALTRGKAELGRALTHDDLAFTSPYNTYASDGLPPQPICNPGRAALLAVLHPEHHNFLYFVADGKGGHAFAASLAEHNQNINRWHKLMENVGQK